MALGEIHVGDIGTVFRITIKDEDNTIINVSSASSILIKFQKPNGDVLNKSGSFYSDGTDGIVQWTTTSANDLDADGLWKIQVKITIGSSIHNSDIGQFKVYPNIV